MADLEWGAAWALESARSMMEIWAATMMARNDHEEKVNAVSEAVRSKGAIRAATFCERAAISTRARWRR